YTLLYDYYSNWGEAMTRFCLKNLTLDYEEGDKYLYYLNADTFPEIIHNQISTTDIEEGYLELGRNIGHLSCKYFKFVANTQIENIRAGLTSQGEISPLTLFVPDENSTGNPIWDPNIWPSTGMEFVLDEFGPSGTYPRAYLIIINPDPDNDNCQYSLTTDINTPELQTPVIHYPVSGQVITSNYDYQPFKVTLSINNLPNDPLNPNRELEYVFELYKNNNSNLVDSQIIPEDHNNPNGTTSCQITLNDQTGAGGLYYWRCKARIVNSNDRSLWTPLSDFYVDSSKIQNPNNRHQYQLFDTEMTWIDAYAYCEILGGHLATITSQDEDDFVYSNLGIDGINIWLGGTDEETEGAWKWITGESWSYTNWGSTQPDNLQNGQNYLSYFDSEPGKWDDDGLPGYNNTHPFICEWSNYLITLTIPKIATEGNGIITEGGIVSVASVPDTDLVLNLSSNDPSVILLPATVTIYADQNSATFDINILDNCIFNDSQIMTITASAYGYISGSNTIQIADNDVLIEMNLLSGWSMISLPVISCNISVSSVFPEAKVVYGYEENLGYYLIKEDENIIIGKGYWILLDQNQKFSLTGQPIPSYNKTIHHEGWAMIGGCTSNARPITDNCNIGVIYKYVKGTGYQRVLESEDLESGQGYWILFKNVEDQASLTVHGEWPGEEPSSTEFISASPQTIALICARNNNLSPYNL
ncbi:MAG: C-type lectin domain-containing protein, partial [bacterium]